MRARTITNTTALIAAGIAVTSTLIQASIDFVIRVALRAVCFPFVTGRPSLPAQNVLDKRNRLKVASANAMPDAAEMIKSNLWPRWEFAKLLFVDPAVRLGQSSSDTEISISSDIWRVYPEPAGAEFGAVSGYGAALVDLRPEAANVIAVDLKRQFWPQSFRAKCALVMSVTPAVAICSPIAYLNRAFHASSIPEASF